MKILQARRVLCSLAATPVLFAGLYAGANLGDRSDTLADVEISGRRVVLEVAFDSIHLSKRHKSGLAMRFPRISRIRKDKPAHEADRIATLQAMVTA